ncbi:unnamed protein product [Strongylus vulgaris]|uniref:Uncharacterized protein n=1 Tax=Strongylus vulgaris TaxID=40348 RepID=A0A3P7IE70_STRVU|nr:unnamed protein product [Strongylus vulgaris]
MMSHTCLRTEYNPSQSTSNFASAIAQVIVPSDKRFGVLGGITNVLRDFELIPGGLRAAAANFVPLHQSSALRFSP